MYVCMCACMHVGVHRFYAYMSICKHTDDCIHACVHAYTHMKQNAEACFHTSTWVSSEMCADCAGSVDRLSQLRGRGQGLRLLLHRAAEPGRPRSGLRGNSHPEVLHLCFWLSDNQFPNTSFQEAEARSSHPLSLSWQVKSGYDMQELHQWACSQASGREIISITMSSSCMRERPLTIAIFYYVGELSQAGAEKGEHKQTLEENAFNTFLESPFKVGDVRWISVGGGAWEFAASQLAVALRAAMLDVAMVTYLKTMSRYFNRDVLQRIANPGNPPMFRLGPRFILVCTQGGPARTASGG